MSINERSSEYKQMHKYAKAMLERAVARRRTTPYLYVARALRHRFPSAHPYMRYHVVHKLVENKQ